MTIQQTYLLTLEQLMEMKSMIMNLQSEMESLKNQVDDFTTKWVDTYDVMAMLRVSRRTIDNYIEAASSPHLYPKTKLLHHHPGKGIDAHS